MNVWGACYLQNTFNKLNEKHTICLKRNNAIFSVVGYIKLSLVILLGVSVYFIFTKGFLASFIVVGVVELTVLIALWIYHNKLHEAINYSNGIIAINKRHLDRISGNWSDFGDIGEEFYDTEHAYACDLDIVGQKSLFQYLNTTHTWYGRQAFTNDLLCPRYSKDELLNRQAAISELSKDIDFANHMEYYLSKIGIDASAQKLVEELKDKSIFIKSKIVKYILMYAPILTFIFFAAIIAFQLKNLYMIGVTNALVQMILWLIGMPKTQSYLQAISGLPYKLSAYSDIIGILKEKDFTSSKLKDIQASLGTSDLSAAQAIKELDKISDKVSVRHNGIICFILNVLLLWDFECAILYEEWKSKYAHLAESWFLAMGEFESLLCFSNLPNVCSNTCLPVIVTGKNVSAQDIGHPLILNDTRVNNDVSCNNNIFIISGSNMSGKTTFLRTVGINLVLGRAGSFVCARQMQFSLMDIMTSMRIADNLNEGISTFYAELKRIKSILELAKKEKNMIFLIDEIFRGTNSVDRLSGAKIVISKLNGLDAIGIITTHDLDLCELANQYVRIKNYSFSEHYMNNKILFDYKMKPGKSNTTNAKYLMEIVGIL